MTFFLGHQQLEQSRILTCNFEVSGLRSILRSVLFIFIFDHFWLCSGNQWSPQMTFKPQLLNSMWSFLSNNGSHVEFLFKFFDHSRSSLGRRWSHDVTCLRNHNYRNQFEISYRMIGFKFNFHFFKFLTPAWSSVVMSRAFKTITIALFTVDSNLGISFFL